MTSIQRVGNQEQIRVYSGSEAPRFVKFEDVLIDKALEKLKTRLGDELAAPVGKNTYAWFAVKGRLEDTLAIDQKARKLQQIRQPTMYRRKNTSTKLARN